MGTHSPPGQDMEGELLPNIATDLIAFSTPGLWTRLRTASDDGRISGLHLSTANLEEHGLPRDQAGFVMTLNTWYRSRIPVPVAFALWLLRAQQGSDGSICRSAVHRVVEANPVSRFLHLARLVGETTETDEHVQRAARWLVDNQLADGSVPSSPDFMYGETGTTARAARALHGLGQSFERPVAAMWSALENTARPVPGGAAWYTASGEPGPATGATSLAILALVDKPDPAAQLLAEVGRWLLHVQDASGGWPEMPGGPPTAHNTTNAVRALRALLLAGVMDNESVDDALTRAGTWLDRYLRGDLPSRLMDLAFVLRLATALGRTDESAARLAHLLVRRANDGLRNDSDLYDTEMLGLALLEWSRLVDDRCPGTELWRWDIPRVSPPFLRKGTEIYDVLYSVSSRRVWRRLVDAAVGHKVLETLIGRTLGVIAALAVVDQRIAVYLAKESSTVAGVVLVLILASATIAWSTMRLVAASSRWPVAASLLVSLLLAVFLTRATTTSVHVGSGLPALLTLSTLTMLLALIVDAVTYTADRSGIVARLLPAN
jgi:Prenyltransferase and squalene oxidase repeat